MPSKSFDLDRNVEAKSTEKDSVAKFVNLALASIVSLSFLSAPFPAHADGQTEKFKLPPIDFSDKNRCKLSSSTIGQANAARDKLYDLRQCQLNGASAVGFDLSGVIMTKTDVSKANFQDAYFSKGYLQGTLMEFSSPTAIIYFRHLRLLRCSILSSYDCFDCSYLDVKDSNFEGADFTNAIVDRASFKGSSLRNAIFKNTVLTGTNFDNADVEGADFTEAALGSFDLKSLCKNPTLKGENPTTGADTRFSVGCGGS